MIGVYIDQFPRIALQNNRKLIDLGMRQFRVVFGEYGKDPLWEREDLRRLCMQCIEHDCEVVLTVWPSFNTPQHNRKLFDDVDRVLDSGFVGLELELEHNALSHTLPVVRDLMKTVRELGEKHNVWLGSTTFPSHPEADPERVILSDVLSRFCIQAHSIASRNGVSVRKGSNLYPGNYQRTAIAKALKINPRLSVCLPAWNQGFPDMNRHNAMLLAYATCSGFFDVIYWSSKHILSKSYAFEFVKVVARTNREPRVASQKGLSPGVFSSYCQ